MLTNVKSRTSKHLGKRAASDDESSHTFDEDYRAVKRRKHADPRKILELQAGPSPITPGLRRQKSRDNKVEDAVPFSLEDSQHAESLWSHSRLTGLLDSTDVGEKVAAPPSPPSFMEQGMVATPPIAQEDLDLEDSFAEEMGNSGPKRPSLAIDSTPPPQEAALPSPIPSPVTLDDSDDSCSSTKSEADESASNPTGLQLFGIEAITPCSDAPSQLAPKSTTNMRQMIDTFDGMSEQTKLYFMHQLLRRTEKPILQYVVDVVNPAMKCDFITRFPPELSLLIIRNMDAKTLCSAAQVSRRWREIIDSDDKTWKLLLKRDGYELPQGELERGVREGWAWQGVMPFEKDLSETIDPDLNDDTEKPSLIPWQSSEYSQLSLQVSQAFKFNDTRMRPYGDMSPKTITSSLQEESYQRQSPLNAETPELGLKSLRLPRLYKTLYRRHYAFDKAWMNEDSKPHHLAFRAHGRHVVTCLQFDDDKILTGSDDTKIHVYDSSNGALRRVLDGHEGGVWALRYEGNTLVSGSTDRTVRVWDLESGNCTHIFYGHTSTVRCLVILKPTVIGKNPDGTPIIMPKEPLIITGSRDFTLRVWRLPNIEHARMYTNTTGDPHGSLAEDKNPYFLRVLAGHLHSVRAIAAHGDTLVSGSYDSTVRVWRISTGEPIHKLSGHTNKVYSVVLDPERQRCISGSMDNMVKVWSLATGDCIFNLEGHTSLVGLLDLSYGRLVSAAADSTLRVWDPNTGYCKAGLSAHTGAITCFQHDGQKVISGSDRSLKMWDVKTGNCVTDLLSDLSGGWQVRFDYRKCVAAVQRRSKTYIEVSKSVLVF
jgi:F-box and WD-40 domain protein CDC4